MDVMLVRDIAHVKTTLERGERVEPAEVGQLLARVKHEAPKMDTDAVKQLKDDIDAIEGLVREAAEGIAEELKTVQATREAHHGYSHLRSHQTGQKLYRKA
jgi:hypothetical protein